MNFNNKVKCILGCIDRYYYLYKKCDSDNDKCDTIRLKKRGLCFIKIHNILKKLKKKKYLGFKFGDELINLHCSIFSVNYMKPKISTLALCVHHNSTTLDEAKCRSITLLRHSILVSYEYDLSNVAPTFRLEYDDLLIERCEHLVKFYILINFVKKKSY